MSTERFCALCNKTGVKLIENLCEECYRKLHPLIEVREEVLRVPVCRECLSYVFRGRWSRVKYYRSSEEFLREIISKFLDRVIQIRGEAKEVKFTVENPEVLDLSDLSHVTIDVVVQVLGRVHPAMDYYWESAKFKLQIVPEVCPVCRTVALKRERAILQVRAKDRALTADEKKEIVSIVSSFTQQLLRRDREARIVEVRESENYIDIIFPSASVVRSVAHNLRKHFVCEVLETQKVVGMSSSGRPVTKVTVRVLLPPFREGDVIVDRGGRVLYVVSIHGRKVKALDLERLDVVSLSRDEAMNITRVISRESFSRGLVLSVQGAYVQVLRYSDCKTVELAISRSDAVEPKKEVLLVEVNGKTYIIPQVL